MLVAPCSGTLPSQRDGNVKEAPELTWQRDVSRLPARSVLVS